MRKLVVLAILFLTSLGAVAESSKTAAKPAKAAHKTVQAPLNWASVKQELLSMAARFSNQKISEKAKIAMLPHANEVLSDVQDLKYNAAEKAEQIRVVVAFLAASYEADLANSNTDTIYFDYKANKPAYLAEINKLKGNIRLKLIEAFRNWEDFERKANLPEPESDTP